jgi:hypothetical protein
MRCKYDVHWCGNTGFCGLTSRDAYSYVVCDCITVLFVLSIRCGVCEETYSIWFIEMHGDNSVKSYFAGNINRAKNFLNHGKKILYVVISWYPSRATIHTKGTREGPYVQRYCRLQHVNPSHHGVMAIFFTDFTLLIRKVFSLPAYYSMKCATFPGTPLPHTECDADRSWNQVWLIDLYSIEKPQLFRTNI